MSITEQMIRPFQPDDLDALQAVRAAAFVPVFESFRQVVGPRIAAVAFAHAEAEQARLLADLTAPGSGHEVWVAVAGYAVLGFVSLSVDEATRVGEIGLNAVHPDHAGRGLGTRLYRHALARMKARGMRVATVGTGGDASHAAARRAYAKAGFGPAIPSLHLYRLL